MCRAGPGSINAYPAGVTPSRLEVALGIQSFLDFPFLLCASVPARALEGKF